MRHRIQKLSAPSVISLGQASTALVSSLALIVTARSLGADGRGSLVIVQSLVALSVAAGIVGLPTLILRRDALGVDNKTIQQWLFAALALTTGLAVASALGASLIMVGLPPPLELCALVTALLILNVLAEAYAASLQRQARFVRLAVSRASWTCASFLAIAGVAYSTHSVEAALWAGAGAFTAIFLVARTTDRLSRRESTPALSTTGSRLARPTYIKSILESHLSLVLLLLVYRLDVLALGLISSNESVGHYSVAYAAAEIAWMYVNGHSISLMASAASGGPHHGTQELQRSIRMSMFACVCVCVAVASVGYWLIPIVFGEAFAQSYLAFIFLIPGVLAFVPFKLRYSWALGGGASSRLPFICFAMICLNLLTLIPLASQFGANGAAASASLTYMFGAFLLRREVAR